MSGLRTLARAVKSGLSSGEPLPSPWPVFDAHKIALRRSGLHMVAGPPGSMKTLFTLNMVNNIHVPTLYHSSDSDDFTMAARAFSMRTGTPGSESEEIILERPDEAVAALREMSHVKWNFHAAPSLSHMDRNAEAFREIHGEYPHLTVIDILMDVDYEGATEQNYWSLMSELKVMARDQQTALLVVHHTSESAKAGAPPPRSAIMGKANQLPTLILTLWGDGHAGTLDVATVKNRFGPGDAMAKKYFRMTALPELSQIEEAENSDPNAGVLFRDGLWTPDEQKVGVSDGG